MYTKHPKYKKNMDKKNEAIIFLFYYFEYWNFWAVCVSYIARVYNKPINPCDWSILDTSKVSQLR